MLSLGSSMDSMSAERETALVGVRFSRRSNDRGGQAPALRLKKRPADRRARACPSPCHRPHVRASPSVGQEHPLLTRSGAGTPELQSPIGP